MNEANKMIKENHEISKKLNKENQAIYTDIVCYIRVSSINEKEEIISDILDMFLRCQEAGKPIEEAIENDYKGFCDSIIGSVSQKRISFNNLKEYLGIIINGIFILLTIDFVFNYIPKLIASKSLISYQFNVSFFITTIIIIIISIAIVKYIGKNSFKFSNRKSSKKENFLFGSGFASFIILMGIFQYVLRNYVLFSLSGYYVFFVLGIYWIYKLISKIKDKF
ncbi:DUF1048 domain-containing protein [Clostridium pasteurianum]|uniref:DUF1048 domain-containing protein n=1 Tax=Clostridium pasteurianum BC1 TaxID=86416 RepID=R4K7I3_CLOPA|nr:DUF1048 domain-containing protein [Clostridium pasteurianum]AGK96489.1 hypothetical protein Clopa_1551 [Clostridium pasteurianum BC1]